MSATSDYLNRPIRSLACVLAARINGWKCPRCAVLLDHPESAEGCRDPQCRATHQEMKP